MPERGRGEAAVEVLLEEYPARRDSLIPLLQSVQSRQGYISRDAVVRISRHLGISQSEIYGVATFYAQFRLCRRGRHVVALCEGTACHVKGGARLLDELGEHLGIGPGQTTPDGRVTLETVACFGSCALAPVVLVDGRVYGRMTPETCKELVDGLT